jgi:hypothetical protein
MKADYLVKQASGGAENMASYTNFGVFFRGFHAQLVEADWKEPDFNWRWGDPHEPLPDGTQMASAPAAIIDSSSAFTPKPWGPAFNVFVKGANGRLYERDLDPQTGQWAWNSHGLPPDGVQMASAPAAFFWLDFGPAVSGRGPVTVWGRNVFFQGANAQLYERFTWVDQNGTHPWQWFAHGLPPNGARMASAPAAISWNAQDGTPRADVFFGDDTGALAQAHWEPQPGWSWNTDHGQPPDTVLATAPTAFSFRTADGVPLHHVFCGGANGQLYQRWKLEGQEWQWFPHGLPPDGTAMVSAPAVVGWFGDDAVPRMTVVYQGANGRLVGRYWHQHDGWQWDAHSAPHGFPPGTQMASAPAAIAWRVWDGDDPANQGRTRQNVFFQGADGSFWETYWDGDDWLWNNHGRPPGTLMASAPDIVVWVYEQ